MTSEKPSDLFLGLVASLQMSAWMQLGKITNPMTGKIDRNIEQAKETIDLLGILEERTRGNLHEEEARAISRLLYDLRMNYVEELKSAAPTAVPESTDAPGPA